MTDLEDPMIQSIQLAKDIHRLLDSYPPAVFVNCLVSILTLTYHKVDLPKDFFMHQMSIGWDLCKERGCSHV